MRTNFPQTEYDELAHQTISLAVSLFSSKAKFAEEIGVSSQLVNNWLKRDKRVSIEMAPFVVAVCSHPLVTLDRLRPDFRGWTLIATHEAFSGWRNSSDMDVLPPSAKGWICPRCNTANAPYNAKCMSAPCYTWGNYGKHD